jgi:hypothetical protein
MEYPTMTSRILSLAALPPALLFSLFVLAQPVLVVQDYGAAPRQELRYKFTTGPARQATMNMQMTMSMGGQQAPAMAIPTIRVPVSMRTIEVLADGSARYEFEMGEVGLAEDGAPALAQSLGASLGEIGGLTGWGWVDARGNTLDGGFSQPTGASSQANQMMGSIQGQIQQLSAPFPAEAVGVGARWQLTSTLQLAGATVSQTAEYTLMAHDGDRVELNVTVTQAAPTAAAGMPAAAQAALSGSESTGSGKMTVDLSHAVPTSEMTMNSSTSMGMSMQMTMSITPD